MNIPSQRTVMSFAQRNFAGLSATLLLTLAIPFVTPQSASADAAQNWWTCTLPKGGWDDHLTRDQAYIKWRYTNAYCYNAYTGETMRPR